MNRVAALNLGREVIEQREGISGNIYANFSTMSGRPSRPSALKARENIRASSISESESELSPRSESEGSMSDREGHHTSESKRM